MPSSLISSAYCLDGPSHRIQTQLLLGTADRMCLHRRRQGRTAKAIIYDDDGRRPLRDDLLQFVKYSLSTLPRGLDLISYQPLVCGHAAGVSLFLPSASWTLFHHFEDAPSAPPRTSPESDQHQNWKLKFYLKLN